MNPARTFGPSMVVCMSSTGNCSAVVGSWYWIYWIGPFTAAWLVAEVTALMNWNVDEQDPIVRDTMKTLDVASADEFDVAPANKKEEPDVMKEAPAMPEQSVLVEGTC